MTVLQNFLYFFPSFKNVNPSRTGGAQKNIGQLITGVSFIGPEIDSRPLLMAEFLEQFIRQRQLVFRIRVVIGSAALMIVNLFFIIKIIKPIPFPHSVDAPVVEDCKKPVLEAPIEIKFIS